MYLKSIEIHGFKSFANKLVFDFHNGITGIVGPNGSGKSNVADAVRWVLGEQSAKQLRGASMQDVIFAGTENRKPLSYAYVAITLDNSDHQLPVDYNEVTIARRVYRSGESEYLLNGSPCRLKDVNELFYDTGIGKEGYSIIGQGQIDKILSGRPEERRELFDEAAGIVKFKRRKATTQKKLESERENLVRINDILAELERQVGPLERQAEKARVYLKKKEELKAYDISSFLMEMDQMEQQAKALEEKYRIASEQLADTKGKKAKNETAYNELQETIRSMDEQITAIRDEISGTSVTKGKLEGEINVLKEQIHTAQMSDEHYQKRMSAIEAERSERESQKASYEEEKASLDEQLSAITKKRQTLQDRLSQVQEKISECNAGIEKGKNEIIELLNHRGNIKSKGQKYDTMLEQINIQKAQLTKRRLQRKTEESGFEKELSRCEEELKAAQDQNADLQKEIGELEQKEREWQKKLGTTRSELEEATVSFHKKQSRLESLQNIAERYEGYGGSVRRVMEKKDEIPGIHGVVADLMKVEKKYETAVETALGGNIQNVVTEDEATAKELISYLKKNRLGRATFLPLTSVKGGDNSKYTKALGKPGVLGMANELVKTDAVYDGIMAYLLGRVVVVDTIDHAIALAKEFHYSLHIVTLEGEYLSPGGSMAGGAFKNNSNLLGRNRELQDLEKAINALREEIAEKKKRIEDIKTARELLKSDLEEAREKLQQGYLAANTAKLNYNRAKEQKEQSEKVFTGLVLEARELEAQQAQIQQDKEQIVEELEQANQRQKEIEEENERLQAILDEQIYLEEGATKEFSAIQIDESNFRQKTGFLQENLDRVTGELQKLADETVQLTQGLNQSKEDVEKKTAQIEQIRQTILAGDDNYARLEQQLKDAVAKKETLSEDNKNFYQKNDELSGQIGNLEKEIFRLNNSQEKLSEAKEYQTSYMWNEYELTYHNALALRGEDTYTLPELKKLISGVKDEIRKLGDVNVNAIEDFKELNERYTFLKTQHDDLIEAEQTLMKIIEDLDAGMRKQFSEKFADIQREFDKAFKDLFGGGKGTLELLEDEEHDLLECGIRIIAQPPGKKLQNMMQLSGGEKSLTAIALLFAIQNLKPSPFCLLDEIEAALDDSNVDRFAKYLHKLTKNTQFIVITHRRGTMNAADRLYGITMQEKGVSTLVSVNLVEADLDE
ncbi:MAG: chromosome segregation protein SMC [Lachnospiraceae bacterium]|nr:chromosome segregation protein SMC [bacterium]MDY5517361.1 chromosome segregation protein SMC [Lachnospiraceae bacterium]